MSSVTVVRSPLVPGPHVSRLVAALLVGTVVWLSWRLGQGPAGLIYLALIVLWVLPGLPIAAFVFGARHPATWIAGAAIGYPLTALLLWLPIGLGTPGPLGFGFAWVGGTAALWIALWPRRRARVDLPAWSRRDTVALGLVLLLVPTLVCRPFSRLGEQTSDGSRWYRAYFTADFLWHMALTAELEKFDQSPRDPYLSREPLRYYWLHFVPPSVAGAMLTGIVPERIGRLTINQVGTGLIVFAALFLFVWTTCGGRAAPAGIASALAVVASSAEGLYLIQLHLRNGVPMAAVREINVDAVTSWYFGAITIDGLQRALMYNPHHSMSCAAGLIALTVASAAGSRLPVGVALTAGSALALAFMTSPFPGAVLALIFGLAAGADLLMGPSGSWRRALVLSAGALPLAAGVLWSVANLAFEGAGGDLQFGLYRRAAQAPLAVLTLAAGPLLVPAIVGLAVGWRFRRPVRPAVFGSVVALLLMFFVSLRSVDIWIGWRAGQILLLTAPALGALGLEMLFRRRRTLALVFVLLVAAAGTPTTVLDIINAQDVENRAMGPGFPWTVEVTADEQEALDWIRRQTPKTAIVQMEPTVRGRATWTLIPSFAERRMAAGLPISLLDRPEYRLESERVHELYATPDPKDALAIARTLGIDYIYADRVEREHFPAAEEKLDRRPDLFMPVFANREVRIYFVQ